VLDGMIARRVRASSVRPIVRWLLDRAVHGEVIDLAIFLVGAVRYHDAIDDLYALGRHQAFWGLTAWVLDRFGEDTVDLRWARAASAGGIERRRILERIAPRLSDRSDVRDWVLRRGRSFDDVRSQAGADLTAVCAVAGDLADVLAPIDVGDDLLDIACSYLAHLLRNHPTDGIEAYPDGILAVDRLIGHLLDRCDTITRLGCVYTLLVWLEEPSVVAASVRLRRTSSRLPAEELASRWERRESLGWTVEIRDALADDGLRILRRPAASNLVRTTFAQHETAGYADLDLAWQIAPTVVIDLWPEAFRLLQGSPFNWTLFRWLLETDDAARAEQVIQFAARLVPPRAPGDTTMFTSAPRHALGFTAVIDLMDAMHRHGIYNERLVAYGLYADDTVVRDWPAGVLEKRPLDLWGDEVIVALRTTPASCGCFEPTRQRLLAMLPEGLT